MTCKAAVLIDGGFFHHVASELVGHPPTNAEIVRFATACANGCDEIFRVFYYNSHPFGENIKNPISRATANHGGMPFVRERTKQFEELSQENMIAFRRGTIRFNGWKIKKNVAKALIDGTRQLPLTEDDIAMDFQQKGVDIKIGLDVAWLSSRRLVDKMILVTGDTDFVPAMKHARREGVNVSIVEFVGMRAKLSPSLKEHSDECRKVKYDGNAFHLIV